MTVPPAFCSIKFDASSGMRCDQFLFMSGDRTKWLIATNASITGMHYENTPRLVERSSVNKFPHMVRWHNRPDSPEDPWVSLTDHDVAVQNGDVIYGEAAWPAHAQLLQDHNGANVFCRIMGCPSFLSLSEVGFSLVRGGGGGCR